MSQHQHKDNRIFDVIDIIHHYTVNHRRQFIKAMNNAVFFNTTTEVTDIDDQIDISYKLQSLNLTTFLLTIVQSRILMSICSTKSQHCQIIRINMTFALKQRLYFLFLR